MNIRPIKADDFPQWLALWNANNLGQINEPITTHTWTRLNDKNTPIFGLVAEDKGTLVGLVQYVVHPTTGSLTDVCYMQDVFVPIEQRGKGIARKMIRELERVGKREKWARMYWLAERQNEAAQALYKSLGHTMDFTLHILPL